MKKIIICFLFCLLETAKASQTVFVDPSVSACTDPGPANTGTGACTVSAIRAFAQTETITATVTSGSGAGATFTISGSVSGPLGTAGTASTTPLYNSYGFPIASVSFSNGGTGYVVGDNFQFTTTAGSDLSKANFDLFNLDQVCSNQCLIKGGSSNSATMKPSGTFYRNSASSQNTSTTETDLYATTLLANTLDSTGAAITIRAAGVLAANGATKTVRVYFGSNSFTAFAVTTSGGNWLLDATITRYSGGNQRVEGFVLIGGTPTVLNSTMATTDSSNQTVKITGQGTTGTGDLTATLFRVGYEKGN